MRDNKVQFAVVREDPMVEAELIRLTNASNVVLDGDRVVAVAAAILRRVPPAICEKSKMVWYLCDLKVHPKYRGRYLPVSIFVHAFPKLYPLSSRAYAISMDTDSERKNRVALMLKRFPLAPMSIATKLGIVSLDAKRMRKVEPILRSHFGSVSYLSLKEKKTSFCKVLVPRCRCYTFSSVHVRSRDRLSRLMIMSTCSAFR